MAWEFQCYVDGCDYSATENDQEQLIENAQQHVGDAHGDTPTREEVEEYVIGP